MALIRGLIHQSHRMGYGLIRPLLFQRSAQAAHHSLLSMLRAADASDFACYAAQGMHRMAWRKQVIHVGGVRLPHPMILAAGFVKGLGFEDEAQALRTVAAKVNIIPGWRSVPRLLGVVEFGSFTRHPRMGNAGQVMWRDVKTRSTQNRIGLKNPGAVAAATFLERHINQLPQIFGINIAVSPGVEDTQAAIDIHESLTAFLSRNVVPNWFTLNLSCPNTEDDPSGNQTEQVTRAVVQAALDAIQSAAYDVPLWVKVSPDLALAQYERLLAIFAELGVRAVIATNTLAQPTPHDARILAGVGGGRLHQQALRAATYLQAEKQAKQYAVDVIGCGGILDGDDYLDYKVQGITAVQYWSALVYRGPLAAAIIESEYV